MTRDESLEILHAHVQNQNLRRHCYAVEAVMRALYKRLNDEDNRDESEEEKWGIAGLLHDADYEIVKAEPDKHTHLTLEWLKPLEVEAEIKDAILAHGWGYVHGNPEPKTKMEWALYTCDELTGLIVAVALVKPDRRLASVTPDSVMKKWNQRSFAAGVERDQIKRCEDTLRIPLEEFIDIAIKAMQGIHEELGL